MILFVVLRYITLILLAILEDQKYVYYIKYLVFLQYVYIPVILYIIYYICRRNDKIKFSTTYGIIAALTIFYSILLAVYEPKISISLRFGYIIMLKSEYIFTLAFIVIPTIILVLSILALDTNFVNKPGIRMTIIATVFIILDNLVKLFGVSLYPYTIISELVTLLVFNYCIGLFKKLY
ncbi:hypothetical protein [Clostridium folliculivorans]|nr:hypothetical protein [Clostridium folliculivorans]